MLTAVLEARCGITYLGVDIFLNVAGGKISEPAADMAVAAALISSVTGIALPERAVSLGKSPYQVNYAKLRKQIRLKRPLSLGLTRPLCLVRVKALLQSQSVQNIENLAQLIETLGGMQ